MAAEMQLMLAALYAEMTGLLHHHATVIIRTWMPHLISIIQKVDQQIRHTYLQTDIIHMDRQMYKDQ